MSDAPSEADLGLNFRLAAVERRLMLLEAWSGDVARRIDELRSLEERWPAFKQEVARSLAWEFNEEFRRRADKELASLITKTARAELARIAQRVVDAGGLA